MSILDIQGGTIKYPHHKQILFTFPAVARTAIANKRNWNYDRVVIRDRVLPPEREEEEAQDEGEEFDEGDEGDEGDVGDEEEQDTTPSGDPFNVPPPPPFPQSQLSTHFDMGGSSSTPQMPYDATFLQSFVNVQMDVAGLRGYTAMQSNFHRMAGRMDSIEEGVPYFHGCVDRQEAREERRIRCEEERAMREAREYEERRRMNELLWQQSKAIRQLEQRFASFPGDHGSSSTFSPFPPHF